MKTLIVSDERFQKHLTGPGHPERPGRVQGVENRLRKENLLTEETLLVPRPAAVEEIALCHSQDYIELVKQEARSSSMDGSDMLSTGDAPICPDSFEIAKLAVGGVLEAVDAVMTDKAKRVFCAVRPPGHHASRSKGEGFCLFNNIAIGARYAQRKYGIKSILIVDWDVHHGNGTQWIFESDPNVFYFSTHQYPSYPGTGLSNETGIGEGIGKTKNYPIFFGQDAREIILNLVKNDLKKWMNDFKPQLVMISAGFDSRAGDPLGMFNLTDDDFAELTKEVVEIADRHADGKLISVLEGGYDLEGLASAAAVHVKQLNLSCR